VIDQIFKQCKSEHKQLLKDYDSGIFKEEEAVMKAELSHLKKIMAQMEPLHNLLFKLKILLSEQREELQKQMSYSQHSPFDESGEKEPD